MFNAVFRKSTKNLSQTRMDVVQKYVKYLPNYSALELSEATNISFSFFILNCLFSTNHIHLCIFVDFSGIYLHCIQNSLWDFFFFFFGTVKLKMLHENSKTFHFTLLLFCYRFIYSTQEIWLKFENYINTTRKPRNNTIIC